MPAAEGDWYTSMPTGGTPTASSDRRHIFHVIVPAGAVFPVKVRVLDAASARLSAPQDETPNSARLDPTRFELRTEHGDLLATETFPSNSPSSSVFETTINAAGTYLLTSETGAFPISGNDDPELNDDQNSFRIEVDVDSDGTKTPEPEDDVRIEFTQATITCTEQIGKPLKLAFTVPAGTTATTLRNFDLEWPGDRVTGPLTYTPPAGGEITGTMSDDAKWNGPATLATLDDGEDVGPGQQGTWTITLPGLFSSNQVAFEALADGVQLPLSVVSLNQPPKWIDPGVMTVSEPAGFEPVPALRSILLKLDEPDDGQTLRFSVPDGGDCEAWPPHPFTDVAFASDSMDSVPEIETATLELAVGALDAADSPYCVGVRVFDGGAAEDLFLTVNITSANSAPFAHAGPDQTVNEGDVVTLSGAGSSDDDFDTLFSFMWEAVSGPAAVALPPEETVMFQPRVDGIYEFDLTVNDGAVDSLPDRAQVSVLNVKPTVTPPNRRRVPARRRVALPLGSFADPGLDAPWDVQVYWGDGTRRTLRTVVSPGWLGKARHTFRRGGLFTVTVKVTDKDGATGVGRFKVAVRRPCVVPNVKGKTLKGVRRALKQRNCNLGRVTRAFSGRVRAGRVISHKPGMKKVRPTGAKVKVKLSKGRRP
ncbi:MAG: PKD domain-containing protein [Gaiellaceae bacterium]